MERKKIKINGVTAEVNVPDSLLEGTPTERLNREKKRQKEVYKC